MRSARTLRVMTTLVEIAREWGRIGVIGFGGPPAHIRLLRETVVERRGWVEPEDFEDALGQITPGPVVHTVAAGVLLLLLKRGVVLTLLLAAGVSVVVALSGGPWP